ncbi:hypothetical protein QBC37DRAFT_409892 [Rhypophila decipiens]|uniref:Reverse transcriptase n=1 Tax=Rhypophila decipiens TaxID=261697 RepID=A0AAN6YIW4_9PEZI|nr:hypothetical protein QBC37DRAFT_409892 [Rhypophila decipiens]
MTSSRYITRALPRLEPQLNNIPISVLASPRSRQIPTTLNSYRLLHTQKTPAMASSEVLSQTLSSITAIKLDQLQRQKKAYEAKKHSLLQDATTETDTRKRAKLLVDGVSKLPSMAKNPIISVDNIKHFLEQAQYDPSVTEPLLQDFEASLRKQLDVQSNKYEFASLYGKLVNDWIAGGKSVDSAGSSSPSGGGEYVKVGREEMHQQRATWEEYVFKPKETDPEAIQAYLQSVFSDSSKDCKQALVGLKEGIRVFQKYWDDRTHFTEDTLGICIRGLLRGDLLNDEKRSTMEDFLGNKVVLSEIADVLNMRMADRASWTWGDSPSMVEQRRNLNGRYRFYLDEDLLHTIFIYYIGRRWAAELRETLLMFAKAHGVWKSDIKPVSREDAHRRRYFLPTPPPRERVDPSAKTVHRNREEHFDKVILLDQLPESMDEVRGNYSDQDDATAEDTRKTQLDVTQRLLHRIQTEVLMQTRLGKDITVIRSDFKWFGPSIPHSSIFAVLDFLGVDAEWQGFFRRVLEAPMRFKDDPEDAPLRVRKRGTMLSTPMADFFGESLLFCLDFAVNQKADGAKLYRLHDDMWMFGAVETCEKAWQVITEFTDIFGLDLNQDKTGSVQISPKDRKASSLPSTTGNNLPKGEVKWGFLTLDPVIGRFTLNSTAIAPHISELRLQLSACRSVLDWVQAWNLYATRFFTNNFGQPANCFSRRHIDDILSTFRHVQRDLFPDDADGEGGVADHLRQQISDATLFPVDEIPAGYLYFPTSLGGLGLQNPFIPFLLVRDLVVEDPDKKIIDKFLEKEEFEYRRAKDMFEKEISTVRQEMGRVTGNEDFSDLFSEPFMGFGEFTRYRERTSELMFEAYEELMKKPEVKTSKSYAGWGVETDQSIRPVGEVKMAMEDEHTWDDMSAYDRWVVQVYHRDMISRFGGLEIVDRVSLPSGLISMLRQSRFQWQS